MSGSRRPVAGPNNPGASEARGAPEAPAGAPSAAETPGAAPPGSRVEPLPLRHPAAIAAAIVAAACILLSVTTRIYDPDIWQHLTVGKAIWQLHRVPTTQLWVWPTYGAPDVNASWGFRALLWPLWQVGGVWGIEAWRWITTFAAFGLVWAAARRMGARSLVPLVVMVACSLSYRHRSQARPETLVAVLLALQIWILERWRRTRHEAKASARAHIRDHRPWLIGVAWAWANVHISWHLGLIAPLAYALEAHVAAWRARRRAGHAAGGAYASAGVGRLWLLILAAVAISFVNPFGWRALAQPFDFYLHWRRAPIYFTIAELMPIHWTTHWQSGLPLLLVAWPLLLLHHARRQGLDVAEALLCAAFTALTLPSQRFAGFYALAAAPFVARDLEETLASLPRPRWSVAPAVRSVLASLACVAVGLIEWTRPEIPLGVGFEMSEYPVGACDYIAAHGIRGRGFNEYYNGGYILWRFWPDRARLPFMDIHQSGTEEDRRLYPYIFRDRRAWETLDGRHRFDYALLDGAQHPVEGNRLLDFFDADTTWALVFRDDNAAIFVRRNGSLAALAEREPYYFAPAGPERLALVGQASERDAEIRAWARREFQRQAAASPWNSRAHSMLANLALLEGHVAEARAHLDSALAKNPSTFAAHERLGMIALGEGRTRDALREFDLQARAGEGTGALDFYRGRAFARLGDLEQARRAYRRALARRPGDAAAAESLRAVEEELARRAALGLTDKSP